MEIGVNNTFNNQLLATNTSTNDTPRPVNAFGIGQANQADVELSPQARILQQNEQTQAERREAAGQGQNDNDESAENEISGNEFVRVSSSVGSAAKNNLTSEKATEVYQSIQALL